MFHLIIGHISHKCDDILYPQQGSPDPQFSLLASLPYDQYMETISQLPADVRDPPEQESVILLPLQTGNGDKEMLLPFSILSSYLCGAGIIRLKEPVLKPGWKYSRRAFHPVSS